MKKVGDVLIVNMKLGSSVFPREIEQTVAPNGVRRKLWNAIFACDHMGIQSLEGSPLEVRGSFWCGYNPLSSLVGSPLVVSSITPRNCLYNAASCNLTSLEGITPSIDGSVVLDRNQIYNLADIHHQLTHINGSISLLGNPITSHVLGLLLVEGLTKVIMGNATIPWLDEVVEIINRYLPNPSKSDILKAQNELLNAGLDDYART